MDDKTSSTQKNLNATAAEDEGSNQKNQLAEADEATGEEEGVSFGQSIGALRDRAAHAKSIKERKKAREQLAGKISDAQDQLEDNRYILQNFDDEMAKQRKIADRSSKDLNKESKKLVELQKEIKRTQSDLDAMIREHQSVAKGYSDTKDKTQDVLEQAKKTASGLQSQVNKTQKAITNYEKEIGSLTVTVDTAKEASAAESARRNIETLSAELQASQDQLRELQGSLAHANTDKANAQAAADGATKAYKEIMNRHDDEEKAVRKTLKDLERKVEASQRTIDELDQQLKAAENRMAYAQQVKSNPSATDDLAASIEQSKSEAASMDENIAQMETVQQDLKRRSSKAVIVLGIAVLIVIAIILIFVFMPTNP